MPNERGEDPQAGLRVIFRTEETAHANARADDAEAKALRHLRDHTLAGEPVCGIQALATAIHVHRRTVRDIVDRLEAANLVVNEPERVGHGAAKPRLYACTCSSANFVRHLLAVPAGPRDEGERPSEERTTGAAMNAWLTVYQAAASEYFRGGALETKLRHRQTSSWNCR